VGHVHYVHSSGNSPLRSRFFPPQLPSLGRRKERQLFWGRDATVYVLPGPEEVAEFLGLPYSSFKETAPSFPRHAITPARFGYLPRELLA
jgi:hypothetical protein